MISLPVLLGVLLIGFLLLQVVPTDPATVMAGPTATRADVEAIRVSMGLDQPLWLQFARYLGRVLQLDLGRSMISNRAVSEEIALTLGPTIELMVACLVWAAPLGVLLGTLAARHHGSWLDRAIMALSVMGVSVPVFWIGLLLIQHVGGAGLLPFQGRDGPIWTGNGLRSILLPALTLGSVFVGPVARMTRTSMLETLNTDYVRTARAKGLADWRVTFRHALRNALIPLITLLGLSLPAIVSGALIVENVFNYPGMGLLTVQSAFNVDIPVVLGTTLVITVATVLGSLLADIFYAVADPRIRLGRS